MYDRESSNLDQVLVQTFKEYFPFLVSLGYGLWRPGTLYALIWK